MVRWAMGAAVKECVRAVCYTEPLPVAERFYHDQGESRAQRGSFFMVRGCRASPVLSP